VFSAELLKVSSAKVIVYTGFGDAELSREALALGAKAVAVKGDPTEVLLECIWRVHADQTVQPESESVKIARLSEEECEVVVLLCANIEASQICHQTGLNSAELEERFASIQRKLEVKGTSNSDLRVSSRSGSTATQIMLGRNINEKDAISRVFFASETLPETQSFVDESLTQHHNRCAFAAFALRRQFVTSHRANRAQKSVNCIFQSAGSAPVNNANLLLAC
jgi:hypothetical protein